MSEPGLAINPLNCRVIRFHGPAQSMELAVTHFTKITFSYVDYMRATTSAEKVTVFLPDLWGVPGLALRL
jgi:hypothetical protein